MVRWRTEAPEWLTVLSKDHCATPAKVYLLMIREERQLQFQPIRIGYVVGINSCQVTGTCPIDTFVQAGRETKSPAVTPADHARVIAGARDGQTLIVGTGIAEQEFKVVVALVQK